MLLGGGRLQPRMECVQADPLEAESVTVYVFRLLKPEPSKLLFIL